MKVLRLISIKSIGLIDMINNEFIIDNKRYFSTYLTETLHKESDIEYSPAFDVDEKNQKRLKDILIKIENNIEIYKLFGHA